MSVWIGKRAVEKGALVSTPPHSTATRRGDQAGGPRDEMKIPHRQLRSSVVLTFVHTFHRCAQDMVCYIETSVNYFYTLLFLKYSDGSIVYPTELESIDPSKEVSTATSCQKGAFWRGTAAKVSSLPSSISWANAFRIGLVHLG